MSKTETSENFDFEHVAKKINENYEKHVENINKSCVKSSVVNLNDYYERLDHEIKDINTNILSKNSQSTVDDYANLFFEVFKEYPKNLERPKCAPTKDKVNSTLRVGGSVGNLAHSTTQIQAETVQPVKVEEQQHNVISGECGGQVLPKAIDVLNDFKTFKKKLQQLENELKNTKMSDEYEATLNQLNAFSRQLEKLMPLERISIAAFKAEEKEILRKLAADLEKLNFLQNNKDLFQKAAEQSDDIEYIKSLIDVLSYAMMTIRGYNEVAIVETF